MEKQKWFILGRQKVRIKLEAYELKKDVLSKDMVSLQGMNYDTMFL